MSKLILTSGGADVSASTWGYIDQLVVAPKPKRVSIIPSLQSATSPEENNHSGPIDAEARAHGPSIVTSVSSAAQGSDILMHPDKRRERFGQSIQSDLVSHALVDAAAHDPHGLERAEITQTAGFRAQKTGSPRARHVRIWP